MHITEVLTEMQVLLTARSGLMRRIARSQDRALALGGGIGDGMPRSAAGGGSPLERETLQQTELEGNLREVEHDLATYRRKVQPYIERMPAGVHRVMLRLRYVEWKSMSQVAIASGYDKSSARKVMRIAEKNLPRYDPH